MQLPSILSDRYSRRSMLVRDSLERPTLLVVDEAGQALEAETLLALQLRPRRCLLVGDPKQV